MKRSRWLSALAIGVGAGLLAGLFGVGGGVLLVPALVAFLGLRQHDAHATSLAAILVTAPAAMLGFALDGSVGYAAGAATGAGAIAGAYVGATIMDRLPEQRLRQGFAVLVLVVSARMVFPVETMPGAEVIADNPLAIGGFAVLGIVAGTLSALMGVGGGVILVPVFVLGFGFTQHAAEGTSLLVIIPTALMGAVRHTRHGYTRWRLGLIMGAAGAVGGLVGAQIALALDHVVLQRAFAVFLAVMGTRMLVRTLGASDAAVD